ncbi:phosphoadenylyl-sulfate reductase [methanotrophic endosymbiont of Bathymodiolus puteoserpentis (Logatchev)]|jgi:phosphoadenosine phosphosulfate reductase|uniref:phosphoadenylyl-sulfate reductase n=1 Tax=methanotrophic endosymbiont of Bathymodiolus puteoserpentis (Logatchev) TaxID=343235 RepID=UPI0013C8C896|nr:phosphoadenylyl-sulfate reductase [methanotrophic endosymbiont of Bathymodiolus puteoserpentis (Logatchev)]SHE23530.1 Phosphoadenylyl-sulfate reductase [thioredoxin] / Adenylyl-sulfate reductase [thioredoxin] [methanotrophic endosymbiont of Bathymodiolus puteoserpentis (Logatchev)]
MNTIEQIQSELQNKNPRKVLRHALENYDQVAISFSGAEDVILIDIALKIRKDIQIFSLDTGRLHPETYQFIEKVRKHYKVDIELLSPDYTQLETFVKEKGLFSFYEDGHQECCAIRKVQPLKRKLAQVDAWITGQRKDQSLDTRQNIPEIQIDPAFSTTEHTLVKFNPLVNQSSAQVWDYIEAYQVPFNALHQQGFISIGCEPCTRAVLPNQHERAGRWWWEDTTKKECGLHVKKG